jgi:hypothetical protein
LTAAFLFFQGHPVRKQEMLHWIQYTEKAKMSLLVGRQGLVVNEKGGNAMIHGLS